MSDINQTEQKDGVKSNYFTKQRFTSVTDEVLSKLEQAFALGCTDVEACFYANISKSTLYNYQEANPDFVERKEELKNKPVLMARQTVLKGITGYELKDDQGSVIKVINASDPKLAMDFLKNKQSNEFKTKLNLETEKGDIDKREVDKMLIMLSRFSGCESALDHLETVTRAEVEANGGIMPDKIAPKPAPESPKQPLNEAKP